MKFMVLVKASKDSEAGVMPDTKLLTEMGKYNEDLVKAGILLAGEGLHPSSKGVRVRFSGSKRTVIDGPFGETKELVAGFWLWQVKSKEEAIEWLKRCPNPMPGDSEIELRQVFEADDFGAALTPELRAQEERLRARRPRGRSRREHVRIEADDLTRPEVLALLNEHAFDRASMSELSLPESRRFAVGRHQAARAVRGAGHDHHAPRGRLRIPSAS